jgi:mevalonate kinase
MSDHLEKFHAHGKLLLSAEYFVLDGALALALPARRGQSLRISKEGNGPPLLRWRSLDEQGHCWFEAAFDCRHFELVAAQDAGIAERLQQILREARQLNPVFLLPGPGDVKLLTAETRLDFPRLWGLGTSSTLISLIAQWAGVDAYELQFRTFGGSGYDIACATAREPILYRLDCGRPKVEAAGFHPPFSAQLHFIYLGKKQDSREGIARYRQWTADSGRQAADGLQAVIERISDLTRAMLEASNLDEFEDGLRRHEVLVAATIGLPRIKELHFSDFPGEVKSLGAWGGDFILAASRRPAAEVQKYFNEKSYSVFIAYDDLIAGQG